MLRQAAILLQGGEKGYLKKSANPEESGVINNELLMKLENSENPNSFKEKYIL